MAKRVTKAALLTQMKAHFPDRWEVSHMDSRVDGQHVVGAIKIRCLEDEKTFLSDFTARLDDQGRLAAFTLDGVNVGKFVGRIHQKR